MKGWESEFSRNSVLDETREYQLGNEILYPLPESVFIRVPI